MTGPSSNSAESTSADKIGQAGDGPSWPTITLRLFFAALLLISGGAKLVDIHGFVGVVESYAALPTALTPPSAWALAITEVALGLWLLSRWKPSAAAIVLIALHALYLLWLLVALARGLSLPNCGCFGVYWPRPLTWQSPLEDMALLLFAIMLWRSARPSTADRKRA
jgi:uncharacterized membrane protein YphA (DoxX/SURF4 family)